MPRSGQSRSRAAAVGPGTVSMTCVADGRAHRVPDVQLTTPHVSRRGVYHALCGHVVVAAAMVEPDGAPCSPCADG